jgi:hypothetical protein
VPWLVDNGATDLKGQLDGSTRCSAALIRDSAKSWMGPLS